MSRRRVITEREVERSARAGEKTIDITDAVVTPSARDVAVRVGVTLTRSGAPAADPRPTGRRSKPASPERGTPARGIRPSPSKDTTPAARNTTPAARPTPRPANVAATRAVTSPPSPAAATNVVNKSSATKGLTVALGCDHGGVSMKSIISERLRELGHGVLDFGTVTKEPVDYPDFAVLVANAVADGRATMGVMIDGAGIGSCMAANKVRGVRAAMCYDVTTAANAREHNNANVLTLGAGLIGSRLATVILDTFLATPFAGGRHAPRVDKIDALDRSG